MESGKALRSLLVRLSCVVAFTTVTVGFASSARADAKDETAAKALQKKAMEEDYLGMDFPKAQQRLEAAITRCGADKCAAPLRALLKRDLGVVLIGGKVDKDKGIQSFADAIKIDGAVALDPDLKSPEFEAAFTEAKRIAAGGAPTPAGTSTGQPAGDFTHTPTVEQQVRTPIPVYAEYQGEEGIVKVIARYKGFGMTEWKTVELKKMGEKGWGGLLPCADVQQGNTLYYLQGFNSANDPVATAGDRNNPYKVPVKREKVAEPPHLPNQPPPAACADTGDCPPNFPGCKKPGATPSASTNDEPKGKDGGEFCEEDSECRSGTCSDNKCTEPEGKKKMPKLWVGVFGAFDYTFVSSADDVCAIQPTNAPNSQFPVNDKNYYCVNKDGSDYPYRQVPGDQDPRKDENSNLVRGRSDKVAGGGAFGNIRLMLALDYAATVNLLVGARLGYVLNTYPGAAAGQDSQTFPSIHAELRGTYVIGKDALAKAGFAPYAFGAAGVATFETAVKVSVVENKAGVLSSRDVDAWQLAGPIFLAFGGGARYAFTPRAALMGGLRLNLAFGNAFAPSIGPEVGVQFGF